MSNITVDPEFRQLIPPLAVDEMRELERSVLTYGCLDPVKVWQGIIVDGHNRYRICQKSAIPFETTDMDFASRDDAKVWILRNQLGRRNLTYAQRIEVAEKLRPLIAPKAKEKQREAGGAVPQKSAKAPIDTRKQIAELAGVSHDTVGKMKVITQYGSEEQKGRVLKGKDSINKVYREILPKQPAKTDEYLDAIKQAFAGVPFEVIQQRLSAGECPRCGK